MDKADQPPVGGVVTGSGKSRRALLLRMMLLVLAACVVAGLVAGGLGVYRLKFAPSGSHGSAPAAKSEDVTPAQALQSAQTELKAASTSTEKATAYDHLAQAYLQSNNTAQAISSYHSAAASDTSTKAQSLALGGLAIAYAQAGNIDAEISTLEQLVPLLQKSSDPADQALVPRYQQLIANLGQAKVHG